VNLIGEHTDYNDGFVMPLAIDRHTVVIGRANGLQKYRIVSANAPQQHAEKAAAAAAPAADVMEDTPASAAASAASAPAAAAPTVLEFDAASLLAVTADRAWHNYFRGVVAQFVKAGHAVPFFDVAIQGNVPLGGGLSSSASLEVATAAFLQALLGAKLDATTRAQWCQRAEHEYAHVPCGIMDQMIASVAKKDRVMLLDCRSFVRWNTPFARSNDIAMRGLWDMVCCHQFLLSR
jgi:galactokinase